MKSVVAISALASLLALSGCGGSSVSLENAPGTQWPKLDANQKTHLAQACMRQQGAAQSLPAHARRAVLASDPQALVGRLNLYFRTTATQVDSVQTACRAVVEQRFAPSVRITTLDPGRVMPANNQFLRIQGTVTAGAAVHMLGGERIMPANVTGRHFIGVIEVDPGRHHIYATATFPGSEVSSPTVLVTRRGSAEAGKK